MEISIKQKAISFGDKYKVFVNHEQVYAAKLKIWRWRPELEITDNKEKVVMTIQKKFSFFHVIYKLLRGEHQTFIFEKTSFWYNRYQCTVGKDIYNINRNGWRTYDIFKNDVLVGSWKQEVTFFKGDTYTMTVDDSSDPLMIAAFCLILDNIKARRAAAANS